MSVNLLSHNNNLPQMKSIWLDEDEEAEKLYGMQAQQLMDSGSDYDDEYGERQVIPDLMMINSDKPILNNKKNIQLSGLPKQYSKTVSASNRYAKSKKKSSNSKKFFKNLFGSSGFKQEKPIKKKNISTPYHFQHISHAGGMEEDEETEDRQSNEEEEFVAHEESEEQEIGKSCDPRAKQLSSIFVTESIPQSKHDSHYSNLQNIHHRRRSSSVNNKRSSYSSSIYSSATNSTRGDRIMSSSTMATTILDRFPTSTNNSFPSRSNNSSFKSAGPEKEMFRPLSEASEEDSIQFLKDYSFPTLLEDKPVNDFDDHTMAMSFLDTPKENLTLMPPQQLPPMHSPSESIDSKTSIVLDTPVSQIKRRNSLPLAHSLSTPELENMLFKDSSSPKSAKRVSLGDVIMYYNQASTSTESPSTFASPKLL
ncbi:hypothetical protein C6P45_001548 [Maudiozyma exigua]|uniref:CRIB domain-containing protein n=1 Tax=Maudiozyma exigua TaxID=34358 RepID=A0A9P7B6F3_MAUEX|nr:hypothetical protein C6P45_001548 [Kazachstania exigua]